MLRSLARRPGYAAMVLATMAVGIGASTSIFSILRGTVLRPLPYPAPDRLLYIRSVYSPTGGHGPSSIPNYLDMRASATRLSGMAGFNTGSVNLATSEAPVRARALTVTANFFQTLGVGPSLGRGFREGEDRSGAAGVVVITDRLWHERFGGRRDVLGQTLYIDGAPRTVVGVLPPSFWFPGRPQLVVPYAWTANDLTQTRGNRQIQVLGRLAPTATRAQANVELQAINTRIFQQYPDSNMRDWSIETQPARDWMLGYGRTPLRLLAGGALLVLLIGCLNVAGLMLVQAERRQRELAVRAAMGAGRWRVTRGFLAESLILAFGASAIGVALAWGLTHVLLALFGDALPRAQDVSLGPDLLAFAVGLALLTGLLVGLVPAVRKASAEMIHDALRAGAHGVVGGRAGLQKGLVAGEVALAVVVVAASGLLLNGFWRLVHVNTGIRPQHAFTFSLELPPADYGTSERIDQFARQALARIKAIPGVRDAGITQRVPLEGGMNMTTMGSSDAPGREAKFVEVRWVTPGLFAAAGIPLLQGRMLTPADGAGDSLSTVVISDVLARALFPTGEALGKSVHTMGQDFRIVGVVGSVREFGLDQAPRPAVYWAWGPSSASGNMVFVVRTGPGDPLAVLPQVRQAIAGVDPNLPLYAVRSMQDVVLETTGNRWFATALFAGFAIISLLLAALGVFGVLAFAVEQRRREVGIRVALGATAGDVVRLVVAQGLRLVAIGLVVGLAAALFAGRLLTSLLYDIKPTDPLTLGTVTVLALATATLAAWLPARRAAHIEPMRVIREE